MSEKLSIKNRHGLKLVIQVDGSRNSKALAFVAHGQGGFIGNEHIQAFTTAFLENNYRVVRFDATNSVGESGGNIMNVTYDNYVEDLEDVIAWARTKEWFQSPFALCGHSMGAQSTTWYAEHNVKEVSLLLPMAPVVNYDLYISTKSEKEVESWRQTGYLQEESVSKPGLIKRVGWGVNESLKKFDILKNADKLTMPMLNIVGEHDEPCPVDHQEIFIDAAKSAAKTLIILKDLDHNYRRIGERRYSKEILDQLTKVTSGWLSKH